MLQTILPRKIVRAKNFVDVQNLKIKKPVQPVLRSDLDWKNQNTIFNGAGYIILDFGKEMNGGIRIITGAIDKKNITVRIRFGESVSETCAELGEKGACNDHGVRDMTVNLSFFSNAKFGDAGFRFVRIDFLDDVNGVIQNVFCENNILVKKTVYRYNGSDKLVKNIFDTAKRTVDLCAAGEYVWDGVKRDRLVWIGDMHPEMLALTTLYGRLDRVENSLKLVRDATPDTLWMNGIPAYSMWWVICVVDYYKLTGAKDFIMDNLYKIEKLVKRFDDFVDENGDFKFNYLFVDWPCEASEDREAGVRAINIFAANLALEVLKEFDKDISVCERLIAKLKKKPITVKEKKQVIALKYFALGEISDQEYEMLIRGGAEGISTFMSYYILKAIASRNVKMAIDIMKEYYGAMLDIGATTFFEDFNMAWLKNASRIDKMPKKGQDDLHGDRGDYCYKGFRHSFCHGWSSGVIKFIQEYKDYLA